MRWKIVSTRNKRSDLKIWKEMEGVDPALVNISKIWREYELPCAARSSWGEILEISKKSCPRRLLDNIITMTSTSDRRGAGLKVQTEELFLMSHSSNWCGSFRPKSNSHVFLLDAIQLTSNHSFLYFL